MIAALVQRFLNVRGEKTRSSGYRGKCLGGRVDVVSRRHVCESDGRQLPFARCPRLGANESGASVNDDGEAGFSEQEVISVIGFALAVAGNRGGERSRQAPASALTCSGIPGMADSSAAVLSFWLA
jgi:hypothetical protein